MQPDRTAELTRLMRERILVLDGAMGTMIQQLKLGESDFRGVPACGLHDHGHDLKGDNDLLVLTRPEAIAAIHDAYFEAGADIVETNTFNATSIAQADYGLSARVHEMNRAAASIARGCADRWTARTPDKPRFVAGALGPTNRTASISPDVNDPGARNVTFDELAQAYRDNARGLIDGGADILLVETVFDTLNAKAALFAIEEEFAARGRRLPVICSGTITDLSGRTLSGQTPEAFLRVGVARAVARGRLELRARERAVQAVPRRHRRGVAISVSVYPNAGLPNAFGGYDETPAETSRLVREFAHSGFVNIIGGCCGTTPAHIRAIADAVRGLPPRVRPAALPRRRRPPERQTDRRAT